MPDVDNWNVWSKHVLAELGRLNDCYEKIDHRMANLELEVAMLKVKAGVWGLMAGAVPVAIMVAVKLVTG